MQQPTAQQKAAKTMQRICNANDYDYQTSAAYWQKWVNQIAATQNIKHLLLRKQASKFAVSRFAIWAAGNL